MTVRNMKEIELMNFRFKKTKEELGDFWNSEGRLLLVLLNLKRNTNESQNTLSKKIFRNPGSTFLDILLTFSYNFFYNETAL
jgi:hypothetical protein